jgi:hypothetical protein
VTNLKFDKEKTALLVIDPYNASNVIIVRTLLWKADAQSGFVEGKRRMQCDHKAATRPQRVDFCQRLERRVQRFP